MSITFKNAVTETEAASRFTTLSPPNLNIDMTSQLRREWFDFDEIW